MDIKQTIQTLSAISAPSGTESAAAELMQKLLAPLTDSTRTDAHGSVIALKSCGRPGAKRLLLDAHIDEVSLVVTAVEDGGFLRFAAVRGSVDPRVLPGLELRILAPSGEFFGVVTCMPPHIQTAKEQEKAVKIEDMFIDTGLKNAAELIPVGTRAAFRIESFPLAGGLICGKSLDDRAGCAVILRCLELLRDEELSVDLIAVASVQEEVGCIGAQAAAYGWEPDFAVAVDVTHGNSPDASKNETFKLGSGPVIGVGPNIAPWAAKRFKKLADEAGIKCSLEVMERGSGTNAQTMQVTRGGVATAVLSLPLRYMHTPVEVVSADDAEKTAQLLSLYCKSFEFGEVPQCWSL